MIDSLLIANRGEIACRIIKTAQEMGIRCIAVYSEADASAPHVRAADEAVLIGPAPAADSYLQADRIIKAAVETGADAIHPGYGFLSENAEFAEACQEKEIAFIGPSAASIRAMGLKDQAKALMDEAGVPVTPGYHGDNQDPEFLSRQAETIGYPVLIKAVAGGGGKGMRRVDQASDFSASLESCRREAKKSFGDDRVLIEKFILNPRHIEVQVFGDQRGRVVHMYERDCSLQRRHQKVLEEAPAPGMTPEVRAAMCSAAINAARAVDYVGAGTVEFIVDGSGPLREDGFYFMEMNTRLQVEHPVTEAVTGMDLVALQIHVASGGSVPEQDEIRLDGHAIEARLYAEDPDNGFLPSTGPLDRLALPEDDDVIRVDTGVVEGGEVSLHYDPMIAKIIAHAPRRTAAAKALAGAIDSLVVHPVRTNGGFLRRALLHPAFLNSELSTDFIDTHLDELVPTGVDPLAAGCAAIAAAGGRPFVDAGGDPFAAGDGWRANAPARLQHRFVKGDTEFAVSLALSSAHTAIQVNERTAELDSIVPAFNGDAGWIVLQSGDDVIQAETESRDDGVLVSCRGDTQFFAYPHPETAAEAAEAGGVVKAPMPGKVLSVSVSDGDSVTKGDTLLVLEAMKMEHALTAPRDGMIATVGVQAGQQVAEGDIMVALDENEG